MRIHAVKPENFLAHFLRDSFVADQSAYHSTNDASIGVSITRELYRLPNRILINGILSGIMLLDVGIVPQQEIVAEDETPFMPTYLLATIHLFEYVERIAPLVIIGELIKFGC